MTISSQLRLTKKPNYRIIPQPMVPSPSLSAWRMIASAYKFNGRFSDGTTHEIQANILKKNGCCSHLLRHLLLRCGHVVSFQNLQQLNLHVQADKSRTVETTEAATKRRVEHSCTFEIDPLPSSSNNSNATGPQSNHGLRLF